MVTEFPALKYKIEAKAVEMHKCRKALMHFNSFCFNFIEFRFRENTQIQQHLPNTKILASKLKRVKLFYFFYVEFFITTNYY